VLDKTGSLPVSFPVQVVYRIVSYAAGWNNLFWEALVYVKREDQCSLPMSLALGIRQEPYV